MVWLRRDLRCDDHAALHHALRTCRRVWVVFVFDTDILQPLLDRGLTSDRRVEFIHHSLAELDTQLQELGAAAGTPDVRLLVAHGTPLDRIPALAQALHEVSYAAELRGRLQLVSTEEEAAMAEAVNG